MEKKQEKIPQRAPHTVVLYDFLIKRFKKSCKAALRQTRPETQAGLTPGKDDHEGSHKADRKEMERFYLRIVFGQHRAICKPE